MKEHFFLEFLNCISTSDEIETENVGTYFKLKLVHTANYRPDRPEDAFEFKPRRKSWKKLEAAHGLKSQPRVRF